MIEPPCKECHFFYLSPNSQILCHNTVMKQYAKAARQRRVVCVRHKIYSRNEIRAYTHNVNPPRYKGSFK